ncbi:MAG: cation transporter, partial [Rhodospirillaceae bacterium]|nr:cation transporter [Rhodospirillaceae bacterium]
MRARWPRARAWSCSTAGSSRTSTSRTRGGSSPWPRRSPPSRGGRGPPRRADVPAGGRSRAHHHHHHQREEAGGGNERRVFLTLLLTGGFMVVEAVGGVMSGSLALIADAGHMLTDTAALALSWLAFRAARRPPAAPPPHRDPP